MHDKLWLIPLLPLLGFLISGLGRNSLGKIAGWIASFAVLGSFLISLSVFNHIRQLPSNPLDPQAGKISNHLFDFFNLHNFSIGFDLQADALTALFLLIITGIGFLIHIYSIAYMSHDKGFGKFFAYLNLFVFSMLLLVMGNNYLILFIGWEGVGLCSYLLIGFWYKNLAFTAAARKAFVMNRIGDLGFLIGMFMIFAKCKSLDFGT
ncbi:MAG: proton-conducting transporter membrane subunit [Chitinophagaceae bacterium]